MHEDKHLIGLLSIPTATEAGMSHFGELYSFLFVSDEGLPVGDELTWLPEILNGPG